MLLFCKKHKNFDLMKTLKLILLFALSIFLYACTSTDEHGVTTKKSFWLFGFDAPQTQTPNV